MMMEMMTTTTEVIATCNTIGDVMMTTMMMMVMMTTTTKVIATCYSEQASPHSGN